MQTFLLSILFGELYLPIAESFTLFVNGS